MKRMATFLAGTALVMATSSAMATEVNLNGMQAILDGITKGGHSSVNAATDFLKDPVDALWTTGGTGISSATMIIELTGEQASLQNVNSFGIYDSTNTSSLAQLFGGTASAGHKVAITFGSFADAKSHGNLLVQDLTTLGSYTIYNFNSSTFGFYFNNGSDTFYSDTTQNSDQSDHMIAYAKPSKNDMVKVPGNLDYSPWLANEFVLGFEDLPNGGDHDYDDMVLMVESVAPVPEPGTMLMLGAGFLGLAIYGKRRRNG